MKKPFLFCLLSMVFFISLFGCGGGNKNSSSSAPQREALSPLGEFPLVKEKAELSVLAYKPVFVSDLNNNRFSEWYEELTGVHVTYTHVPSVGAREATNLLLAAGEYPDIIFNDQMTAADDISYGSQGIFLSLNDLYEKQGYYIKQAFERYPDLPQALVFPDGNMYSFPSINDAFHTRFMMKAWMNDNWLTALNLRQPATTEEFYNVLKAFKTQDPNGNGRADEIPMMGAYEQGVWRLDPYVFLLNSFVYFDPATNESSGFLERNDGKIGFVPVLEDYREGLRYVARLISEGLLDPSSLTQSTTQFKQLGTNPSAPLIGIFTDFLWVSALGGANDTADHRANSYSALAPLAGPKGIRYSPSSVTPYSTSRTQITDHCKDPELAMRWIDGLYSVDVTMRSHYGVKGYNWDDAPEGSLGINQKPAIWKNLTPWESGEDPYSAREVVVSNRYSDLRLGELTDFSDPATYYDIEPRLYRETYEKYAPYAAPDKSVPLLLYFTTEEVGEYTRLREQINTYARENLVAFITGNKSLDRDWNSYIAEFQKLELPRYLQYVQTAYDRQYKK